MNTTLLVTILFNALGVAIIYVPWLFLWHSEKLTGKELSQTQPKLGWVRSGFPALNFVWAAALNFLIFQRMLFESNDWKNNLYIGALFASIVIFNGLFALLIGICPVPANRKYLYADSERARLIGLLQIISGIGVIAVAYFSNNLAISV